MLEWLVIGAAALLFAHGASTRAGGNIMADYTVRKTPLGLYTVTDEAQGRIVLTDASASNILMTLLNGLVAPGHSSADRAVHNYNILCDGGGHFADAWPLASRLDFPPMQNCVFDARSVTFVGEGIRFDSFMECDLAFGVLAGATAGVCLEFSPRTPGPDGLQVIVDSRFQCSAVVGVGGGTVEGLPAPPPAGSIGVLLNTGPQSIQRCTFTFVNIHSFERGIYAPNPGPSYTFQGNQVEVRGLFDDTIGVQDGDPNAGGNLDNRWVVGLARNITQAGVLIYGARSLWSVTASEQNPARPLVVLESGAHDNQVSGTIPLAMVVDQSGNTTNHLFLN